LCYGQSAKEALNALKKLDTVVQTGVSYRDYSGVLADAKHPVSLFLESSEAKLNQELADAFRNAVAHHDFALGVWRLKFSGRKAEDYFNEDTQVFQVILQAYPDTPTGFAAYVKKRYILIGDVLSFLWGKASTEIGTATKLVGQAAELHAAAVKEADAIKTENDALRTELLTIKIRLETAQKENAELKTQVESLRKENSDLSAQMRQSSKPTTRRK
jgi:hypothetical protein